MDLVPTMPTNVMPTMPVIKEKKPTFKSIMAELLKPPPKDDSKPNVNLGGGQFSKLDKI
jgi:hypothetical protein